MKENAYYFISSLFTAITAIFTLAGLVFACIQLWQIKTNRKRQFDQSRREKTVDMIMYYSKNISKETKSIEKIVANFTDEQCQDLYNGTPFRIDQSTKEKICNICPEKSKCRELSESSNLKPCEESTEQYCIKENILYFLRGNIISYLNTLESVLLSWQLGIVDQQAIEEQFLFLDKKRQRERALEIFRNIAGNGHSYPAIEKFYQHLQKKRDAAAEESLKDILN